MDLADRIVTLEEGRIVKDTAPITLLQQSAGQNL
jgi:ABC-type proline/glycine betaine transport system ATPase subunit